MGEVGRGDRTVLSEAGRSGAATDRDRADTADSLCTALVQSVGSWSGRSAVRLARVATVRGDRLGREPVPDETTVCKFRHLLEEHGLGRKLFEEVNEYLKERGMAVNRGTIVDATIIHAPSSTKNRTKARDPEMHQTRKGNQWYFGMTAHIGVDSRSNLIHSVEATAANVHDSRVLKKLLHGKEKRVWGDSGIRGRRKCWPRRPRRRETGLRRRAIVIGGLAKGPCQ